MQLNLKHRFPVRDGSDKRFWYTVYQKRLFRHTNNYEDWVEITPTNEIISIGDESQSNMQSYSWSGYSHHVMYVNRDTDDWFDLVYHFLSCNGFKGLYINGKKDVCIEIHMFDPSRVGYYIIRYMSWEIDIRGNWLEDDEKIWLDVSLTGFYCIYTLFRFHSCSFSQKIRDHVLVRFREVVIKDNYKTKKMMESIIEGNTYSIVNRLYDMRVVCCL